MLILLYGSDDYRREQKKREIVAEFTKKHDALGAEFFNLQDGGAFDALTAFLRNQSIFETKKLAVLTGVFPSRAISSDEEEITAEGESEIDDKDRAKNITGLLRVYAEVPNTTILISEKKKPTKTFGFLLKKPVIVQEFESLSGPAWMTFAQAESKRYGVAITTKALGFLEKVYGGDSWALATELQKLAAFKSSPAQGPVDEKDLAVFDLDVAPNYWGLVNAAKGYDLRMRLTALETLFAMNDPAPKIFNILAASWREKIPQMADYDRAIKSGKLEYEEALLDLVIG